MTRATSASLFDRYLYLVCDASFARVEDALEGGVDILQLRDRTLSDNLLLAHASRLAALAHEHGALFFINDRPDVALLCGADGVHVGQDDLPTTEVRRLVGNDLLIGLSTHSEHQIDQAEAVDYLSVGPIHETPTKPGRPSVGHALVTYAAEHLTLPWFALGDLNATTIPDVISAGAQRIAVVRAITTAADPRSTAQRLRRLITP